MKVRYIGRATKGVYVVDGGVHVDHGATAEFPKAVADSLLASGEWEKVDTPKPPKNESEAEAS